MRKTIGRNVTLDAKVARESASADPDGFIAALKGEKTVLDEVQLVPDLFFALKEKVRKNKAPGQFILSGSVRFTSKKLIRESLTGRIQHLELLPFSIAEIEQDELPGQIHHLLESEDLVGYSRQMSIQQKTHQQKMSHVELYLENGGLPGVLFLRKEVARRNKIEDQLRTILDRDLRQVYQTNLSFERIENFCRVLSAYQGSSIQYTELRKETELTPVTQQKLLNALESIFLIRRIPIEGGMKGYTIIFEDQAESFYYSGNQLSRLTQLTHLLYRNIRTEFFYRYEKNVQFFQYRTRAGVIVPLALRSNNRVIGFMPIEGEKPSREEKASGDSFLRTYMNSKMIYFHEHSSFYAIDDRMMVLPLSYLV